jgi:uncharacterized protein YbjT (DUF2867 family)
MAKTPTPKIIVIGASGYVGKATLGSLVQRHGNDVEIYAGVRDPAKFGAMEGVKVVKADMGNTDELTETLKEFDRVYLVTPGHEDRTKLVLNALEACKAAAVEFALILSVATVDTDSVFGNQLKPIEEAAKKSGLRGYSIVRLPLFIDNNYANAESIKNASTFYDPRDVTKLHTPVAVADVGKASADILANPKKHYGKTYTLVMAPFSISDLAKAFSKALGKQISVTTVPYEQAKEAFMGMGFPEWQVNGIMELFKFIDAGNAATLSQDLGDIKRITGESATTLEEWVTQNAAGFQ